MADRHPSVVMAARLAEAEQELADLRAHNARLRESKMRADLRAEASERAPSNALALIRFARPRHIRIMDLRIPAQRSA